MTESSSGASQVRVTEPSSFTTAVRFVGAGGGSAGSASTTAASTAAVAALVSVSSLPASSVKFTFTLTVLPSSASASV